MADPGNQAFQSGSEILSDAPIPFRFEITWRSLTEQLKPTPPDQSTSIVPIPAARGLAISPMTRRPPVYDAEAREWEMVLPRMRRPAAVAPKAAPQRPLLLAAPQFTMALESDRLRRWIGVAGVVLLLAAGAAGYKRLRRGSSPSAESMAVAGKEMGSAGWITEWASDSAGSARGRQISLYRPSVSMSDYRLEFLGRIEHKSLGWVFRAADSRNYYVAKLEAAQPAARALTITHFAVIRGFEGLHIQRTLKLDPGAAGMLRVRLEARGPRFTVYVQNQVVEDWEDDRLKSGGLGFLNEREERGQVQSIQISFPKGGTH
jgi:hypothetical protein